MIQKSTGLEHLLAAAITGAGGALTVQMSDLESDEMEGKSIAIDLNDDTSMTLRLVDYDPEC